jgi:KRAB domain-containing zinc finger protein
MRALDDIILTSKTFLENAPNMLKDLWNNPNFTDVTLATSDKHQIKAHRIILSSCSPFFQNILVNNPHQNPFIYLKGVKQRELESIIEFVYLGKCQVKPEDADSFLETCKELMEKQSDTFEPLYIKKDDETLIDLKIHDIQNDTQQTPQKDELPTNSADTVENTFVPDQKLFTQRENGEQLFPCEACNYVATTNKNLRVHIESVHDGIRYRCDQCDQTMTREEGLKRHKEKIHGLGKGQEYICEICGDYKTRIRGNLSQHIRIKHGERRFPCDQCEYKASTTGNLRLHRRAMHEGVRYKCDTCDHEATQVGSLKKHRIKVHKIHDATGQARLNNKMGWDNIVYKCELCNVGFTSDDALQRHNKFTHKTELVCGYCDFKTSVQKKLENHAMTHRKQIKYKCNQCKHKATTKGNLNMHTRNKHEGKRFHCDACLFSSTNNNNLLRHKESKHQNVKYKCNECACEYSSRDKFLRHKKNKHEGKWYQCDQCDHRESYPGKILFHKQQMHAINKN